VSYVYHALYAYFARDNVGLPGWVFRHAGPAAARRRLASGGRGLAWRLAHDGRPAVSFPTRVLPTDQLTR
jgi:hypothetical protein